MTVTFDQYRIGVSGTENKLTTLSAISIENISISSTGKKTAQPVMFETEIWIPQGYEGPQIKGFGYTSGTDWLAVYFGDVLKVVTSTYTELSVGTYWWVDNSVLSRDSGFGEVRKYELTLVRSWRDINGVVRV